MKVVVNGQEMDLKASFNVTEILSHIGAQANRVAVERNMEIVPKSAYDLVQIQDGDRLEVVRIIGGGEHTENPLVDEDFVVAGRRFSSRLITGTGKYDTYKLNAEAEQR